ncbi:ABC transporter permease [Actinoallomurus iriomotensis]|uniref:ABC transporter n=1 Tax=Actinoallomurus iriomotensis TaxID=478107 RepID=A0A9W6VPD5_9ACTN|nr:FtsX-like permease family protein [Actinoallomurus iriomotensis]GLY79808.1 ABC transporter [Actinoallomurus iriomotensis]
MLKTTLAGLRAHLLRLVLTALAITLGVGFVSGTFVLTDTMRTGFDQQFTASADKVSVAVLAKQGSDDSGLPPALLSRLRSVPGVQDAQGLVRGTAPLVGKDGKVYGDNGTAGVSLSTGALQRYTLKAGRAPSGPDTAVLDTSTARRTGYKVGDTVSVLDKQGHPHSFTVSGLADFGIDQEIGYRGAVGFTAATATAMTGERGYTEIDLKAAPGTTDARLRDAVARTAGGDYDVLTSARLADRMAKSSGVSTGNLTVFFLAFAIVALFVAALVIYNTFNILIAQRTREMALLRCVGATRGQVFRGVLIEAAIVGLVASAFGVLVGIGLGAGGATLFASADNTSSGSLTVSVTPVVVGLVIGLVVTLVSALLPARAATRVPPVAALRSQVDGPVKGRAGVLRMVFGGLPAVAGLGLIALALLSKAGQGPFLMVLAGALLVFLGVIGLSPFIVRRLSRLVGWLPARLLGVPGRLARDNAGRNPKRAAITTIALTVGVTLMTTFSVALASTQATATAQLAEQFPVDYQLTTAGGQLIPRQAAATLRTKPQLADVIEVRESTDAQVDGRDASVGTVTGHALGRSVKPKLVAGSITDLRPGTAALHEDTAKRFGVGVGRQITVTDGGHRLLVRVAAVFSGEAQIPNITVNEADFDRTFGAKDDSEIYVMAKDGVSADASRQVINDATKAYPMVKVGSLADVKAQFTKAFNQLFLLVGALLGLAIIISLIGIANTLTLSVVERTRESALLRALGLTRSGLRWMLSLEAVIMAVIGALLGVVLGTGFGWAAISAVASGAVLGFPAVRVLAFVLVAGVAGLLAAVIPSRRAARASIVASLAAD